MRASIRPYLKPRRLAVFSLAEVNWHDYDRMAYLTEHIASVERAIAAGVPVRGYFAWSIMDNFEWAEGYAKRFGLIYVDFETQERLPKRSALAYKAIIENSGLLR